LKKGYYSPAELGSLRQAAPIELLPDSNYQVSAYPVTAVDLAPGDGLQDIQIYCNTCHSPATSLCSRHFRRNMGSRGEQDE